MASFIFLVMMTTLLQESNKCVIWKIIIYICILKNFTPFKLYAYLSVFVNYLFISTFFIFNKSSTWNTANKL